MDYPHGLADLLRLRPVNFRSPHEPDLGDLAGVIAEEVHDAGLTEFVCYYDADGRPDAIHYPLIVALPISAIKDLKSEVDALRGRVSQLENPT